MTLGNMRRNGVRGLDSPAAPAGTTPRSTSIVGLTIRRCRPSARVCGARSAASLAPTRYLTGKSARTSCRVERATARLAPTRTSRRRDDPTALLRGVRGKALGSFDLTVRGGASPSVRSELWKCLIVSRLVWPVLRPQRACFTTAANDGRSRSPIADGSSRDGPTTGRA